VAGIARWLGIRRRPGKRASLEAAVAAIEAVSRKPDSELAGEAAAPSAEESISIAPDAPSEETSTL
jgi:hypothetical protein